MITKDELLEARYLLAKSKILCNEPEWEILKTAIQILLNKEGTEVENKYMELLK